MANGKLKIKESRKLELKVNGKEMGVPKEYDFTAIPAATYECDVTMQDGKIMAIAINGAQIPKKEDEIKRKAEQAQKREQEANAKKEEEKQERMQQRNIAKPTFQNNSKQDAMPSDSFSQRDTKTPSDLPCISTEDLKTSNFSLKLYKFARFDSTDSNKAKFFAGPKSANYFIKTNDYGLGEKIVNIAEQHEKNAKLLFAADCLKVQTFKPDWRVIVGLGTDSVYETGITLHHIYGFPYIPASGIKGIVRSYIIQENYLPNFAGQEKAGEKAEKKALENNDFLNIFGSTNQKGKITFFDAMPVSVPQLKPDIMNVHYPDYYGGSSAPADTQSPRPIYFLTVHETSFQFMIGCKEVDKHLLQTAYIWLENALKEKGIGAKTAVGYGYMQ
jgi:CRISPR-associated protein Cmr6